MGDRWRLLPYGPAAALVELDSPHAAEVARRALTRLDDLGELVPAERTVLVRSATDRLDRDAVAALLATVDDWSATEEPTPSSALVEVPVRYDGADLVEAAEALSMSVTELVERHTAPTYRVAFCGFAPGFAYLTGLDPALALARRPTPRTEVPAGSVAMAFGYSAVYPRPSPGGWHLLGHTGLQVWDPTRANPALLTPGTPVRFRAVAPR